MLQFYLIKIIYFIRYLILSVSLSIFMWLVSLWGLGNFTLLFGIVSIRRQKGFFVFLWGLVLVRAWCFICCGVILLWDVLVFLMKIHYFLLIYTIKILQYFNELLCLHHFSNFELTLRNYEVFLCCQQEPTYSCW